MDMRPSDLFTSYLSGVGGRWQDRLDLWPNMAVCEVVMGLPSCGKGIECQIGLHWTQSALAIHILTLPKPAAL